MSSQITLKINFTAILLILILEYSQSNATLSNKNRKQKCRIQTSSNNYS